MELVLEIGTEEIPASYIPPALKALESGFISEMKKCRISHGEVRVLGTPRRLALLAHDMAERQEDALTTTLGPPKKVAFDKEGRPTQAALGFAKSQGVGVEELSVVTTSRGEYLSATVREEGRESREVLKEVLPQLIASLPFPKSMRWNESGLRFARPIRWIVAVLGGQVVPFELGGLRSGNTSYGHRFMSPKPFEVWGITSYLHGCGHNFIIVDPEKRKELIRRELQKEAGDVRGRVVDDPGLLEAVNYLVEYPFALRGKFDESYLKLPQEVLITVMKEALYLFSVIDEGGRLMPYFVTISNTAPRDASQVIKGNERVLRAKLADANFFFEEDRKVPLESRVDGLKGLVFHTKLGNMYDKVQRLIELSSYLAEGKAPEAKDIVRRAAYLAKADLTTMMVTEFPKLQGVMGREYAIHWGERPEVAQAIAEHNQEGTPASMAGALLSLADKIDTLSAFFAAGLIPTGAADPYGLRRTALGIIDVARGARLSFSLDELLDKSLQLLKARDEIKGEVKEFIRGRLLHLLNQDYPYEVVDAILSVNFDDIYLTALRVEALNKMREEGKLIPLAIAYKRVNDLLNSWSAKAAKQVERTIRRVKDKEMKNRLKGITPSGAGIQEIQGEPEEGCLIEPAEKELHRRHVESREKLKDSLRKLDFKGALDTLFGLKGPIDDFFDHVLVITDDEILRANRLRLLKSIRATFLKIADLSRVPA